MLNWPQLAHQVILQGNTKSSEKANSRTLTCWVSGVWFIIICGNKKPCCDRNWRIKDGKYTDQNNGVLLNLRRFSKDLGQKFLIKKQLIFPPTPSESNAIKIAGELWMLIGWRLVGCILRSNLWNIPTFFSIYTKCILMIYHLFNHKHSIKMIYQHKLITKLRLPNQDYAQ